MELLLPNELNAGFAVVTVPGAPGVFIDTPDPVTPSGDVIRFEEFEELVAPGKDVLLLGVEVLKLVDDEGDGGGVACVKSSEIPLLPSTDPV